ncbi:MAG: geranylgeranyl reductase family protein [Actinomycetota bacterium]
MVGAGPAGSAAAIAALRARPAARVLLLDRAPLGRDKVCGDGIAPHAVAELEALDVIGVLPTEVVATVRLSAPGGASNAAVTSEPGYVVPRSTFDERLARAAIEAGAELVRHRVRDVQQGLDGVEVDRTWSAPVLIAADGSNSLVRRRTGQPANTGDAMAIALRGYAPTPAGADDELQIRWDARRAGGLCYAWAFPTDQGTTNVGYGMSSAAVTGGRVELVERMHALLPDYDLDGVTLTGHTLPLSTSRPEPTVGRVLLVGDAASLINPFTGEGIYSAIASGAIAGAAAVQDPTSAARVYRTALAARFGRQHRQMRALYPLINSRLALDTVIRACQREPRLFDRLLDVGLGDASFSAADFVRFGRHLAVRPQRGVAVGGCR